jgi:hypothetical protein
VASFRCKAAGANHLRSWKNQFRVEATLHKWQMLETAFALRPVLFRALDARTSAASLCSWSIHHRHGAGDAAQSDLRDFCNRPHSHREPNAPFRHLECVPRLFSNCPEGARAGRDGGGLWGRHVGETANATALNSAFAPVKTREKECGSELSAVAGAMVGSVSGSR